MTSMAQYGNDFTSGDGVNWRPLAIAFMSTCKTELAKLWNCGGVTGLTLLARQEKWEEEDRRTCVGVVYIINFA